MNEHKRCVASMRKENDQNLHWTIMNVSSIENNKINQIKGVCIFEAIFSSFVPFFFFRLFIFFSDRPTQLTLAYWLFFPSHCLCMVTVRLPIRVFIILRQNVLYLEKVSKYWVKKMLFYLNEKKKRNKALKILDHHRF